MELFYLNQVLDGNTSCFSYFIDKYKNMAFSIAFRITNNKEDAEEAVQDSFLKAFGSLSTFRQEAAFSTWLYKIVVNTSITKAKRKKILIQDIDDAHVRDIAVEHIEEVYKTLEDAERKKLIGNALQVLVMEDRLLLTLYYLNENSIDEIKEITGIKADNVKMKLHRARKKLYIVLEKNLLTELKNIL
jgi:RNA polymerase sigma factor (sigma-70 family)